MVDLDPVNLIRFRREGGSADHKTLVSGSLMPDGTVNFNYGGILHW